MEVEPQFLLSPEGLKEIYLRPAAGGIVPLSTNRALRTSNRTFGSEPSRPVPAVTFSFNLAPEWPSAMRCKRSIGQNKALVCRRQFAAAFPEPLRHFNRRWPVKPFLIVARAAGGLHRPWDPL